MRIEAAAREEDVRLCGDGPAEVARQHPSAVGKEVLAAAKVEARPVEAFGGDGQPDRAGPEQGDRCPYQRPHAEACERAGERRARRDQRGDDVDHRRALEIELANQQHFGNGDEGNGQEKQNLHVQQLLDQRLAVIVRHHRGERELDRGEREVHQDQHAEGLPHQLPLDMLALDQCAGESITIEEGEEGDHHLTHREQPIVARIENTHHGKRDAPRDDLRHDLTPRAPGNGRPDGFCKAHATPTMEAPLGPVRGGGAQETACSIEQTRTRARATLVGCAGLGR